MPVHHWLIPLPVPPFTDDAGRSCCWLIWSNDVVSISNSCVVHKWWEMRTPRVPTLNRRVSWKTTLGNSRRSWEKALDWTWIRSSSIIYVESSSWKVCKKVRVNEEAKESSFYFVLLSLPSSLGSSDIVERIVFETVDRSEAVLSCSAIVDGNDGGWESTDGCDLDLFETTALSLQSLFDQGRNDANIILSTSSTQSDLFLSGYLKRIARLFVCFCFLLFNRCTLLFVRVLCLSRLTSSIYQWDVLVVSVRSCEHVCVCRCEQMVNQSRKQTSLWTCIVKRDRNRRKICYSFTEPRNEGVIFCLNACLSDTFNWHYRI